MVSNNQNNLYLELIFLLFHYICKMVILFLFLQHCQRWTINAFCWLVKLVSQSHTGKHVSVTPTHSGWVNPATPQSQVSPQLRVRKETRIHNPRWDVWLSAMPVLLETTIRWGCDYWDLIDCRNPPDSTCEKITEDLWQGVFKLAQDALSDL